MLNLIASLLAAAKSLWESLKQKPEPEEIPVPVDPKKSKDLLNPEK